MNNLEWMIIVDGPGTWPVVIVDDGENTLRFQSAQECRDLMKDHPLNEFEWWAFNFKTGESE